MIFALAKFVFAPKIVLTQRLFCLDLPHYLLGSERSLAFQKGISRELLIFMKLKFSKWNGPKNERETKK